MERSWLKALKKQCVWALVPFLSWYQQNSLKPVSTLEKKPLKVYLGDSSCQNTPSNIGPFLLKIAKASHTREKGLSSIHQPLPQREGMLFLFDPPQPVTFWMKETYIPLQILFFDSQDRFNEMKTMPVEKNPKRPVALYPSNGAVEAAIELNTKTLSEAPVGRFLCVDSSTH